MESTAYQNIVFGASGLVGTSIIKFNKHKFIYTSRKKIKNKKIKWMKFALDTKKISIKKINIGIFLSSPRYLKKNLTKKIFNQEFLLLKKVSKMFTFNKFIYISSSTIYNKKHPIGSTKRKCEAYLNKNSNLFKNLQIWRPYNLIGTNQKTFSDHFHNYLFKIFFIQQKVKYKFLGNKHDERGYSDVDEFSKILLSYMKKDESFTKNFGNKKSIKLFQILKIYNKEFYKIHNFYFQTEFNSKKPNKSLINKKSKNTIFSKKNNKLIFQNYLRNMIKMHILDKISIAKN